MSRRRRSCFPVAAAFVLTSALGACAIDSPVSVTDRPLAEKLEDRRTSSLDAQTPRSESALDVAPDSIAFAEAQATGDFLRLHVTDDGRPAGLRSGPGPSYDLLSDVPAGAEVFATGNRTGEWVHVVYADFDGWLAARRIRFDPAPGDEQLVAAGEVEGTTIRYVVSGEAIGVNIRAEPDASSELVTGAPAGSFVTGSGNTEGAWIEVNYDGVTGWASGNYLDPVDGAPIDIQESTTTTVAVTLNTDE